MQPAIPAHKLTKNFAALHAHDQLTLGIERQLVSLLGPNDGGTSTSIRLLLALIRLTACMTSNLRFDCRPRSREARL